MDNSKKRILLVEDEVLLAMHEKQQLEDIGYSINHVIKGEDAVQQAVYKGIDYDLILMDVDLGSGIDGTETAEEILKHKEIPVVFLSSHTEPEIVEKTEKITSYGYVVKRSSITVLDASIKMALKLYKAKNEEKQAKEALRESEATIRNKLKVITEPEEDIDTLALADIVDVDELQALLEDFYTLTGILSAVLDTSGKILVACGWQDICTKFHRVHPESCKNCLESDTELTQDVPAGTFKLYRCKNNMWDMATPIMVNEKHIGNIFLGQFLFEDEEPDLEVFRNQARQYGFDEAEYLAALNRVPRFTREKINRVMGFYSRLAGLISSLSYSKIKLSQNIGRHKRMEVELKESEERFRSIYNSMAVGVAHVSLNFRIINANQAYCKMLGYTEKELIGKHLRDITAPEIVKENFKKQQMLAEGQINHYRMEKTFIHKTGFKIIGLLDANLIHDANGMPSSFLGSVIDITDRKQAEEEIKAKNKELQKEEENLSITLQSIGDAVITTDINGLIVRMNDSAERLCGCKYDEAEGKPLPEIFHIINSQTREVVANPVDKVLKTGKTVGLANHTVLISKAGKEYLISDSAAPIKNRKGGILGVVLVFSDTTAIYKAQEELKESEERFKALHNASFGGIAIHDKGIILECNQGLSDMTGYSIDELIGMDGLMLIAPESRDKVMKNILAGYEKPYEAMGLRKNGEVFPMRLEARNIPYKGKKVRTVEFRDITEQKQAEEALKETKRLLSESQQLGKVGGWEFNIDTLEQNWTEETFRIHEVDPDYDNTVKKGIDFYTADSRPLIENAIKQAIEFNEPFDLELQIITAKGNLRHVHTIGKIDLEKRRLFGFFQDITKRKQIENELNEKTTFLSKLMETSPVGIVTVDKAGSITYANKRAEHILGLVKDEITARTYDAPLWNHTDIDGLPLPDEKQPFNIVKKTGETAFDVRHGITWPDGTVVILSISATPLKDDQGHFDGMLATIEDITENKKYEDTIIKQLKEKEILLKEVHHRIKNNVSQIEGLLSIQAESTDNTDVKGALQEAVSRVQGIRVLYEKLLLSKDYQDISVKDYIESLIDSLMTVFPESRDITIEKQISDFEMSSKKVIPIGIVVNELITNVLKYAFSEKEDNRIFIKLDREGTQAILSIQDNGIGIDERVLKNKTPGFGITLVKMLADQLGGTYTAENDNGTKSVLKFEI